MQTQIKAIADRIIVRLIKPEPISTGGIILPSDGKETSKRGQIVAAGDGVELSDGKIRPLAVGVGDVVIFCQHVGNEILFDGWESETLLVLRECDVLAVEV